MPIAKAGLGKSQELTELNASSWTVQASDDRYSQLFDDTVMVKIGDASIKLITESGYDVNMSYPSSGNANWNLPDIDYISIWFRAQNPNTGFQSNSPWIHLCTNSGYYNYQTFGEVLNAANGTWKHFYIPLNGDRLWRRSEVGNISLSRIDWIEIHTDTWEYGFTLWIDGLEFQQHSHQLKIEPDFEPEVGGKYQLFVEDELPDGNTVFAENPGWKIEPGEMADIDVNGSLYAKEPGNMTVNAYVGSQKIEHTYTIVASNSSRPYKTPYVSLDILVAICLNVSRDGSICDLVGANLSKVYREMDEARRFYWVNSHCKLNLNLTFLTVEGPIFLLNDNLDSNVIDPVLKTVLQHVGQNLSDYDGEIILLASSGYEANKEDPIGTVGGGGVTSYRHSIFDIGGCICWLAVHEFHHQLDGFFEMSGYPEYRSNHPREAGAEDLGDYGEHFDVNAYILRIWPVREWFGLRELPDFSPTIIWTIDRDGDGIPDNDSRVPEDEIRFGSNPRLRDTDMDHLDDLGELMAGIYNSSNPNNVDTDGDGIIDGLDSYPLYPINPCIQKSTIKVDGELESNWTLFNDDFAYVDTQFRASVSLSWDDNCLYVGVKTNNFSLIGIYIDACNDGWFHGKDNYEIIVDPSYTNPAFSNRIISLAHIWDCINTTTYATGPKWNEQIISKEEIERASKNSGTGYVVELAIPKKAETGLMPGDNSMIGLRFEFNDIGRNPKFRGTAFEQWSFVDITLATVNETDTIPTFAPVTTSSTHPDQKSWYSNSDPIIQWTTPYDPSGIAGYSYILDHSPATVPDENMDTTNGSMSFFELADSAWYFHVRAINNASNAGASSHYSIKVDTIEPVISYVSQNPQSDSVQPSQVVTVQANVSDIASGVDHVILSYRHSADNGTMWSSWTNVSMIPQTESVFEGNISGYQVGTQIQYRILAYDNATNVAIDGNAGQYFIYAVIPEFQLSILHFIIALSSVAILVVVKLRRKLESSGDRSSIPISCPPKPGTSSW
jgi:hypothetical protein